MLQAAGVPVLVHLPGVGEDLQDHAEGLVVWKARGERSDVCATGWDAGYVVSVDPEGRDERMLVEGVRLSCRVVQQEPSASHLVREVFPGDEVQSDAELSAVLRETHQTVYHLSGTARMGDPRAVLDSRLRMRGVDRLRVVDASVFPTVPALNPVGLIVTVAERAAALLAEDASRA